jgi:hypothetical protein
LRALVDVALCGGEVMDDFAWKAAAMVATLLGWLAVMAYALGLL